MSSFAIKITACLCMLCDHIGWCMQYYRVGDFGSAEILRIIGRLAFPLFAFFIAEGYRRTHNAVLYILRMLIMAFLTEIPFDLCFGKSVSFYNHTNVLFTFSFALIALCFVDMAIHAKRKELRILALVPIVVSCYLSYKSGTDYSYYGVLLIFAFYFVPTKGLKSKLTLVPILLLFGLRFAIRDAITSAHVSDWAVTQVFSSLSLIPIFLYNGKKGYSPKNKFAKKAVQYAFYLFYPVHMIALYYIFTRFFLNVI